MKGVIIMKNIIVAIPVYNESKKIIKCLKSLKSQTFNDFKVIISDNCSKDDTIEIIEDFIQDDNRFLLIKQSTNLGAADNFDFLRNYAIGKCKYFMWLGSHDYISNNYLEVHYKNLENKSDYILSYSFSYMFNDDLNKKELYTKDNYQIETESDAFRTIVFFKKLSKCTVIHGLIREKFLKYIKFHKMVGADNFILIVLQSYGKFLLDKSEANYFRYNQFSEYSKLEQIQKVTNKQINLIDYRVLYESIKSYLKTSGKFNVFYYYIFIFLLKKEYKV